MDEQKYLGIDPGRSGGWALIDALGSPISWSKMPDTESDLLHVLCSMDRPVWATLEKVNAMTPGRRAAFLLGSSSAAIRVSLLAAKIPFEEVAPSAWQLRLRARTKGDKNVTKRKAQELFPGIRVTHAIADALLLAEYGRRTREGLATWPSSKAETC